MSTIAEDAVEGRLDFGIDMKGGMSNVLKERWGFDCHCDGCEFKLTKDDREVDEEEKVRMSDMRRTSVGGLLRTVAFGYTVDSVSLLSILQLLYNDFSVDEIGPSPAQAGRNLEFPRDSLIRRISTVHRPGPGSTCMGTESMESELHFDWRRLAQFSASAGLL